MGKISELAIHFLANAAWQIAVLAIAASICARLLGNVPSRYRHATWVACIALCLALPLWGLLDLQATQPAPLESVAVQALERSTSKPDPTFSAPTDRGGLRLDDLLQKRRQAVVTPPNLSLMLAIAYVLFALYRLCVLWRAWMRARRLRQAACERELPVRLASAAARCQSAFGLKRISLAFSPHATTPATIGTWKPVIILPESFLSETSDEILVTVLGHEMAHIARRDFAFNVVYEFLCLPVSFHPIANMVKRQIARTRELACDDMVTERLLEPEAYARSLVRVAGALVSPARQALTLGVFDADILEERIMKLTRKTRRLGRRATRLLTLCAVSLLCVTCVAISTFSFDLRTDLTSLPSNVVDIESLNQPGGEVQERSQSESQAQPRSRTVLDPAGMSELNSTDAQVRAETACSMGKSAAVEAIPLLIRMLGDDAPTLLLRCWQEGRWNPALDTFKHPSPGEQAAIALASMGMPALEPLTNALDDANVSVRRNAAWAIGELTNMKRDQRENAVAPLVRLLDDSDEWVRMAAARALGEIRDERAVEGLIALLGDRHFKARKVAAWALGEMKTKHSVEALCGLLRTDEESEVRVTVAWALGEIQDKGALEVLCEALASDSESEVRITSAWALGEIGSSKAVSFLNKALSDPDSRVREKAQWALAEIEDSDG